VFVWVNKNKLMDLFGNLLMGRTEQIGLLPTQRDFFSSDATHAAYCGGFGSGKSYVGVLKTIAMKLKYSEYAVAYYLPSYNLVRDIAFPKFTEILDKLGVKHTLNKSDKEILIPGANKIILRTMDNPETIIGYEVAYSCIDEADVLPQTKMTEAFSKIIARNRSVLHDGSTNKVSVVSTPESFGWLYNFFVKNKSANRELFKAKTSENPFLPAGYIATLTESYTPAQLKAYLNGEFVNLTSGSVYSDYDRKQLHSNRTIQKHDKLHIGMDFNITNMNAVINVIDGNIKIAVDEITNAYDTMQMIRIINDKYPDHAIIVYPDASGRNRSTSGKSDIRLLMDEGYTVRAPNKNPFVRDRVNSLNKMFRDKTYLVNSNNCPEYTEALEKIAYNKNEPDKQSGFDHITDAGGYFAYIVSITSFTI